MLNDRNKFTFVTNCCWLAICLLSLTTTFITKNRVQAFSIQQTHKDSDELGGHSANALAQDSAVLNISPRLEYNNEWRPVGRGDPLKNDPTYDYSPPALERVRYWRADNESKDDANHANSKQYSKDFATNNKKEILLLGMLNERHRGQALHSETMHLQPKYTAIRRSYYGHHHQLPTHLMPPPMQTLAPPTGHLMKPATTGEYRHNMPSLSTTTMAMMHSKPYYSTSASSPWMHTSASMMPSTSTSVFSSAMTPAINHHYQTQHSKSQIPSEPDHHHQETINQFSYTRPSLDVSFSPNNLIHTHPNTFKHGTSGSRKPWLHELLQKEVVKLPQKMALNKYEQIAPAVGISTTQLPVAFRPISTTSTPTTIPSSTTLHTTTSPVYFTTTAVAPTKAASNPPPLLSSTVAPTSKRLLIPTTSNLMNRPTVAPLKMTTDALFKHYNQPEAPLSGPMYLIIEGHSKVKTYGKDELDPHRPKIVPIIPKREPVVRIADPNEKRGTKETFEVKHLHTIVTTSMPDTTSTRKTNTSTTRATSLGTTTAKPLQANKTQRTTIKTKQTISTTPKPKVVTTITTTKVPNDINNFEKAAPANASPTGMADFFSFLDSSLGGLFNAEPMPPIKGDASPNNTIYVTTPTSATKLKPITTTTLKPTAQQTQIEARIGTHSGTIDSLLDFSDQASSSQEATTESALRDVRQVFDYDQLPESRLKDRMDVHVKDNESEESSDEVESALNDDSDEDVDMEELENLTSNEYEDDNHQLIKRIDNLVNDGNVEDTESIEFEELLSSEAADDNDEDDDDDDDLERRHRKA